MYILDWEHEKGRGFATFRVPNSLLFPHPSYSQDLRQFIFCLLKCFHIISLQLNTLWEKERRRESERAREKEIGRGREEQREGERDSRRHRRHMDTRVTSIFARTRRYIPVQIRKGRIRVAWFVGGRGRTHLLKPSTSSRITREAPDRGSVIILGPNRGRGEGRAREKGPRVPTE